MKPIQPNRIPASCCRAPRGARGLKLVFKAYVINDFWVAPLAGRVD